MQSARELVTRALDLLTSGLYPFVETELKNVFRDDWADAARRSLREDREYAASNSDVLRWDAHALLTVMWDQWNGVFRLKLTQFERSLVSDIKEFRNRWAHQQTLDIDDAYRMLDSAQRLLSAIDAKEHLIIAEMKREVLQEKFGKEAAEERRKTQIKKDKWVGVAVFTTCAVALVLQLSILHGGKTWPVSMLVIFFFGFLTYQRLTRSALTYGPHECRRCDKVIYSEMCPYCESPTPKRSAA